MKRSNFLQLNYLSLMGLRLSPFKYISHDTTSLMKEKKESYQPKIIGHRGGLRGLLPEHTLEGYKATMKVGVHVLDMDIQITKNKVVVCYHDPFLNPNITKDKNGNFVPAETYLIKDMTYQEELLQFSLGDIKKETEYATIFPDQVAIAPTRIPTLDEVFALYKKYPIEFQTEIKLDPYYPEYSYSPYESASMLLQIAKKHDLLHRIQVQSFNWLVLEEAKKIEPTIRLSALTAIDYFVQDYTTKGKWLGGRIAKSFNDYPTLVKDLCAWNWDAEDVELSEEVIYHAHQLGIIVKAWNNPETFDVETNELFRTYHIRNNAVPYPQLGNWPNPTINDLIKWKIDYIINDRSDAVRGIVAAEGYRLPPTYFSEL